MLSQRELGYQLELLQTYRDTLAGHLNRFAALGGAAFAPPEVIGGIQHARREIRALKANLRAAGAEVGDELNDEPGLAARTLGAAAPTPDSTLLLSYFGSGMGALRALIEQVPQVRDATVSFRTMFQAACEQIVMLRAYKSLHDQLHDLQLLCYENIEQELPRFPDDDLAAGNLERYARNLEDIVGELREIAERSACIKPPLWINKLALAHGEICRALETSDAALLRHATQQIKRVLSLHPALINKQLNNAVRAMRLAALVEVMTYLRDMCTTLKLDPRQLQRFDSGLAALAELHRHLTSLVDDHDQWQEVDSMLRMIDDCLDPESLESIWPELKQQARQLYDASAESWALALQSNEAQLERAVAAHDDFSLVQYFRSYRSRAVQQFYRVDKKLKELCDRLDRMDGPLAFVIGALE